MFETGDNPNCRSLYWFSGNSYDCNYHYSRNWSAGRFDNDVPSRWLQRSNAFLRVQLQKFSATFIIIYEDPFDSAQWNRIPRSGWHRKWNRHNLLFLDGHAANLMTNTTQGSRGTGWKSASGNAPQDPVAWWNNPQDPDYQYRDLTPLGGR
jgi:prepilin-type processing-associated H-X9-DG protein